MTARPLGRLNPGTPEWIEARARRVGGSEIAAVMGMSPWESRFSLWHRKQGHIGPVEETEPMRWGTLLEPVVADEYGRLHPEWFVQTAPTYVHTERDYQTAAPDRLLYSATAPIHVGADGPDAVYEGKTARVAEDWGDPGSDQVPPYYRMQALWYLDVLGLSDCHLAVLIGGSEYREYLIGYDADLALEMRAAGAAFIASIEAGERPDIDDHDATYQAVRELHPDIEDTSVEVDEPVAHGYLDACDRERAAKASKQLAVARLADAMGSARRAFYAGTEIAIRVAGKTGSPPHIRPSSRKAVPA